MSEQTQRWRRRSGRRPLAHRPLLWWQEFIYEAVRGLMLVFIAILLGVAILGLGYIVLVLLNAIRGL